jgi:glycosyltransferase 2 family protein
MSASFVRKLTLTLGLGSLVYFLRRFGAADTWLDLKMIGWRLWAIAALEALIHLTHARAWWHLFPNKARQACFPRIWLVQLAGSALNDTTPGAPLGGEPIKAMLMREQFELPVTAATLLSAKLAQALARALFIMFGIVAAAWSLKLEGLPAESLAAGFVLTACGVATFMVLQVRGLSAPARRVFRYLRLQQGWVDRVGHALVRVDEYLHELYRARPQDFIASVALVLAGLCIGVVQVWLLLGWLGLRRDWTSSLAIESFSVLLNFVFFVVPGSLGVQEGGKLLIFAALGLPLSAGLSLGVAFRLNSLVSLAVGFAALMSLRRRESSSCAG